MLQNRSSSGESAQANTQASVSGYRLDSGGKSMKWVSKKAKKREYFLVRKKMGIFLRDGKVFAVKTEFGNVVEYFCKLEVALRIFLSEEKREEELELENFCPKNQKGERELDLK